MTLVVEFNVRHDGTVYRVAACAVPQGPLTEDQRDGERLAYAYWRRSLLDADGFLRVVEGTGVGGPQVDDPGHGREAPALDTHPHG